MSLNHVVPTPRETSGLSKHWSSAQGFGRAESAFSPDDAVEHRHDGVVRTTTGNLVREDFACRPRWWPTAQDGRSGAMGIPLLMRHLGVDTRPARVGGTQCDDQNVWHRSAAGSLSRIGDGEIENGTQTLRCGRLHDKLNARTLRLANDRRTVFDTGQQNNDHAWKQGFHASREE